MDTCTTGQVVFISIVHVKRDILQIEKNSYILFQTTPLSSIYGENQRKTTGLDLISFNISIYISRILLQVDSFSELRFLTLGTYAYKKSIFADSLLGSRYNVV